MNFPIIFSLCALAAPAAELPKGFVYLHDVAPSIIEEMRYAGAHNFVGRPVTGYVSGRCILAEPAARALAAVQQEVSKSGLTLKVYDCYRPQRAVADFIAWSKDIADQKTKAEFYPTFDKRRVFAAGYVASKSGHSRGSTVDLTLVRLPAAAQPAYDPLRQVACFAPAAERFADNTLDFGTGYDCFEERAHTASEHINDAQRERRKMFVEVMARQGFRNYPKEWWHFTYEPEAYPKTYFDFVVQ